MRDYLLAPPPYARNSSEQLPLAWRGADPKASYKSKDWQAEVSDRVKLGDGTARAKMKTDVKPSGPDARNGSEKKEVHWLKRGVVAIGGALKEILLSVTGLGFASDWAAQRMHRHQSDAEATQADHPTIHDLAVPPEDSTLGEPGSAQRNQILDRLTTHSGHNGSTLGRSELDRLIAIGERICRSLNGNNPVEANAYTARALSWYIAANAALQGELSLKGIMLMPDPGYKIHSFFASVPGSGTRISSHFPERSAADDSFLGNPEQVGLEDYLNRLPGGGGAVLADKQPGHVTMIKFETAGLPKLFVEQDSAGVRVARFIAGLARTGSHGAHYGATRANQTFKRTEHADKDAFAAVGKDIKNLVREAVDRGVIAADWKALEKDMHRYGLPFLNALVQEIRGTAEELARNNIASKDHTGISRWTAASKVENMAAALQTQIKGLVARLEGPQNDFGIIRKGAEYHVNPRGIVTSA